jgi:hypothetical protein
MFVTHIITAPSVRRKAAAMAALLCGSLMAGCYAFVPSESSLLVPGRQIALDLNDLGRLNLSSQIGAEVRQLSGLLVNQSATSYTVKTMQITYLNGRTSEWSGEPVTVGQEYVRGVYRQAISPAKTVGAVAAAVAIAAGIIAGQGLSGNGNSGTGSKNPPPPVSIRGNK